MVSDEGITFAKMMMKKYGNKLPNKDPRNTELLKQILAEAHDREIEKFYSFEFEE